MDYKLLDKESGVEYAKSKKLFQSDEKVTCQEIGDGNINYVFRLKGEKKSYIFKQADELLRSSQRPLSQNRMDIEAFMLNYYNKSTPNFSPKLYFYDRDLKLIAMEDLFDYKNLRHEYMNGNFYQGTTKRLGEFCVKSLLPTTIFYMDLNKRRKLQSMICNEDMCNITEDLVLTEPFIDYKKRNVITEGLEKYVEENIYNDRNLQLRAAVLKEKFVNDKQALIHGDLHTGSIFVKEGEVKIIDPEFATFAPIGYDLGNVLANLFFALLYNEEVLKSVDGANEIKQQIEIFIKSLYRSFTEYFKKKKIIDPSFNNSNFINKTIQDYMTDMYSFCGMELLRRTIGDSKVLELTTIEDLNKRQMVDKILINFSKNLITSPESFMSTNVIKAYEGWHKAINLI
ncbi:S-methyl-5-thioribose kinase [Mediannikoviicoccus vaginalis]|uniref:S-methyl-5-thioribose kinase n=1 Tax=Mediannikoviicoccus vaginalis TaxID=2899727 RepID=UPI001F00223E|nr:S-methyl-5-thioribose kinase [Mediannikoviicoccus vaginalis]